MDFVRTFFTSLPRSGRRVLHLKTTSALHAEPWGQSVLLMGARLRPLWVRTSLSAWPHPLCVCLSDVDPKDPAVHWCAFPNPECPAVCHTPNPISLALFQMAVLLIWRQILNLSLWVKQKPLSGKRAVAKSAIFTLAEAYICCQICKSTWNKHCTLHKLLKRAFLPFLDLPCWDTKAQLY